MPTRVARLEAHNRVVEAEQEALDWKRKTSIRRNIPRSERLYLHKETQEAQEKLDGRSPSSPMRPRSDRRRPQHDRPARAAFARHGGLLRWASHQARVPLPGAWKVTELRHRNATQRQSRRIITQCNPIECAERIAMPGRAAVIIEAI
jgi:hypothetical protein